MICPWCGERFDTPSYSELCPRCDCGIKPDGTEYTHIEIRKMQQNRKVGLER